MPEKIRLLDKTWNTKTIIYRTAGNAISNDFGPSPSSLTMPEKGVIPSTDQ